MSKHHFKKYHPLIIVLCSLLWLQPVFSQKRADKLYEQKRFAEAVKSYERFVKRHEDDAISFEKLGNAYRFLADYKKAELNYQTADGLSGLSDGGFVNYGQMLVKNGKSKEAKDQFERYLRANPESFIVRLMSQSIYEVESWSLAPKTYTINQLRGINSKFADFSPAIYRNGIAFTTERGIDYVTESTSAGSSLPFLAVYYAEFKDSNGIHLSRSKPFLSRLLNDYHIGPLSIDSVHDKVYFSEVGSNAGGEAKIYVADIVKSRKLKKPTLLPFGDETYSVMHPSISPDGNTLFFASSKNDTISGMDIYSSTRSSGGWSTPTLLPGEINTPLNEVFPYAVSSTHLYFSSNGHLGYGGLDIFESHLVDGAWSTPINLKSPLNSESDDFGICFRTESQGYFSTERDGGKGRDDIYQFVRLADPSDSSRMEVAGVFEYDQLPPEGFQLELYDENDNLLEIATTDSQGNFTFIELPTNKKYRVEVPNANADILDQSKIYLLNESGEKVMLLDRISESRFAFKTLEKDVFESLVMIEEDNSGLGVFDIFGQLYAELPSQNIEGLKVVVFDDNGNVLKETLTDSIGLYAFEDLERSRVYSLNYVGKDSIVYLTTVFYQDDEKITQITEENSSLFELNRLKLARTIAKMNTVTAKGRLEYEGSPLASIRMLMLDSNDKQLMAALSDDNGNFNFGKIPENQDFKIVLPDSINDLPGKKNLYFLNSQGDAVMFADNWKNGTFKFNSLKADEYDGLSMVTNDSELANYGFLGQVFRQLPGDFHEGLKIFAVDEEGRIIETVFADSNGFFDFSKLHPDQHYSFRVAETDKSNLNVDIFDLGGNLIAHLRLDELSDYMYEKLISDDASLFAMREEDGSSLNEDIVSGMFYKKLPGDYKEGIMVYAVDEQGKIIDSTMTDGKGHFQFKNLSRDKEFTLQVMDEEDSGMQLAFFGYDNKFDGLVTLDENNNYTYSKLILEAASELGSMEEFDESNVIYGQAFKKIPGDYPEGTRIYAMDQNGKISEVATLDKIGKFEFESLAKEGSYFFRLEEDDQLATFVLLDKFGNVIQTPDKAGEIWVFDRLAHEKYSLASLDEDDASLDSDRFNNNQTEQTKDSLFKENTIYFDYKSYSLSSEDSLQLWSVVKALRADESKFFRINSHTDQSETSTNRSFSALRSVAIVQYLDARGISIDRIYVQNWENSKPVVQCPEGTPCKKEDRELNQRSEYKIVESDEWPIDPDYIISYEFNEWSLPDDAQDPVFGTIKKLKSEPSKEVVLDGYADTWGTYTSNERISQLRAENIKNTMIKYGIDESRISIIWHGESVPFGGCLLYYPCPVKDRKQNRRVEIRIQK